MPRDTLKKNLDQLHAALATHGALDDESRRLLARLAKDIERVLDEEPVEPVSVRGRFETATLKLEAEHPELARLLSEVTDAFSKLGI